MNLQRKLAAKILKCGENRIWIDPKNQKVKQAITRKDIRRFIKEGVIKKLPIKKIAKNIEKSQQKMGSRKGAKRARMGKKTEWFKIVRPQRKLIKELKLSKKIDSRTYRETYKLVKGNVFRSKAHLLSYLKDKKLLKE